MSIYIPRIEKLRQSLDTLTEFVEEPIHSRRDLSGISFGFVVAFEHAWKCLEDRVSDLGYSTRKIHQVLETVVNAGVIQAGEEAIWAQMLEDKNLAWNIYNEEASKALASRIQQTHLTALLSVHTRLRGR